MEKKIKQMFHFAWYQISTLKQELAEAYQRWEELEELQTRYEKRASSG